MKKFVILTGLCLCILTSAQEPGSVASDAKAIAVSRLQDFRHGFAVVSYGYGSAILDSKGNFVLDPEKYRIEERNLIRHLVIIEENSNSWPKKQGIYDLQKKAFAVAVSDQYTIRAQDDFFIFEDPKAQTVHLMDVYGNKSKTMSSRSKTARINDKGTGPYDGNLKKLEGHLFQIYEGYVKWGDEEPTIKKGRWGKFFPFSDGLAAVQAADPATNKVKWGYLNKQGEFAINLTFTAQPGNFYNGLALVLPPDPRSAGYQSAFIDKTGQPVIKLPYKLREGEGSRFYRGAIAVVAPVKNASTRSGQTTFIIKKDGTIIDLTTIIAKEVENVQTVSPSGPMAFGDLLAVQVNLRTTTKDPYALVDLDGNFAFPLSNFKKIYSYDATSGLARAEFYNEDGSVTAGYINSKGVFQIVMKK